MTNRLMNRKRVKLRAKIKMEKDKEKCSQEWSRSKCNRCKWIQIKKSSSKMASNTSNKIKWCQMVCKKGFKKGCKKECKKECRCRIQTWCKWPKSNINKCNTNNRCRCKCKILARWHLNNNKLITNKYMSSSNSMLSSNRWWQDNMTLTNISGKMEFQLVQSNINRWSSNTKSMDLRWTSTVRKLSNSNNISKNLRKRGSRIRSRRLFKSVTTIRLCLETQSFQLMRQACILIL